MRYSCRKSILTSQRGSLLWTVQNVNTNTSSKMDTSTKNNAISAKTATISGQNTTHTEGDPSLNAHSPSFSIATDFPWMPSPKSFAPHPALFSSGYATSQTNTHNPLNPQLTPSCLNLMRCGIIWKKKAETLDLESFVSWYRRTHRMGVWSSG